MLRKLLRKLIKPKARPEDDIPFTLELPGQVTELLASSDGDSRDGEKSRRLKFSVIIPTMWKRLNITTKLIQQLVAEESVEEIIIIGNAPNPAPFSCDKVRILEQPANIYVNPAWNLGVKNSNHPNLIIINDDLLISSNMIDFMSRVNLSNIGLVGISTDSLAEIEDYRAFECQNALKLSNRMNYGYGVCMFLHKSRYFQIPEVLKIYLGDSFLYDTNKLRGNYNLTLETKIKTEMSSTSGMPVFSRIKEQDLKLWGDIYKKIENDAAALKPIANS